MAQKVNITLVDDIDGSEAEETITFGLDGHQYEIDLNSKNAAKLRKALDPFAGSARRVSRFSVKSPKSGPAASDVRAWAVANGLEVPAKGRIPAEILKAYSQR